MPVIQAFRGIRYDLGHVGSLSNVVAPPYDVIDADLQRTLYEQHPANVVRLILNRDEPGDDEHNNRYTRASRLFRQWQRDGILFTEADPAIYVYHQVFTDGGTQYTRRGFMCRVRLERFGEGSIFPHEETHGAAKADRLKLWSACRANLSQIFGLYPDDTKAAQNLLEATIAGEAPLEATDHLGVIHRIWPVTDVATITAVVAAMGDQPVFIADGHHRYETALTLRDQIAAEHARRGESIPPQHPANYVLMMLVSMSDRGMLVLPTHRLFRGLKPVTVGQLRERLGDCFSTESAGSGADRARALWEEIEIEGAQGTLGLYTAADEQWTLARLTATGKQRMARLAAEHSADWQGLGVSILHRLVVESLLDSPNLPAPKYVRGIEEVVRGLREGDQAGRDATGQTGTGGRFELAALVMPATVEHIRNISSQGERMPAKSTYFYPKLLSGLVINPLE
ncbi:MAG TPA: DUF1015 domain-containing protein [Lacipirellulaceae bacterium]|jgi:uncharacterized protein (DUF1015 family)|nr:DUF1015 domain-containing protein [Lacipirellulaceae bacterium]